MDQRKNSQQRRAFFAILEGAPALAFIFIWRYGYGIENAMLTGAGLAVATAPFFVIAKARMMAFSLGANLYLLFAATVAILDLDAVGQWLKWGGESFWLAAMALMTAVRTWTVPGGALGIDDHLVGAGRLYDDMVRLRRYSLVLLAATVATLPISIVFHGEQLFSVVIPVIALFALHRQLIARLSDKNGVQAVHGLMVVGADHD